MFQRIPWRKPGREIAAQQAEDGSIAEDEQDESGTDEKMAARKDAGAFEYGIGSGMRDENEYQSRENRADAFECVFHRYGGLVMGLGLFFQITIYLSRLTITTDFLLIA